MKDYKIRPIEESEEPFYWQPEAYAQPPPSRTPEKGIPGATVFLAGGEDYPYNSEEL